MLSISEVATHCGVTVRTIRHYHQMDLLPEPPRDELDHRSYGPDDLIELNRIIVLADAGVPLRDIRTVLSAEGEQRDVLLAQVDHDLEHRQAELQRTRTRLHELRDNPTFVPRSIEAYVHRLQEVGIPERWIAHERDSWILTHLLCPEWASRWLSMLTGLMADPELTALTLEVVAAEHWDPDDPRIEDLARRTADFNDRHLGTALLDADAWTLDRSVMELFEAYARHRYTTPALKTLNARVTELMSVKWSTR